MHYGEEKRPAAVGADIVFHAGIQHQQLAGTEPVVLTCRVEPYLAVQDVDADGPGRPMGSDFPAGPYHHECHPERPILHQCSGIPAIALEQYGIVQASPLVFQIEAKNLASQRAVER